MLNKIIKKISSAFNNKNSDTLQKQPYENLGKQIAPKIIPRDQHNLSRKNISKNALKILQHLHEKGYQAYLVGGSVSLFLLLKALLIFLIILFNMFTYYAGE